MNFDDYTNHLPYDRKDKGVRDAYNAEEARIRAKFEQDVLAELGLTDHPKGQALMDLAWDKGHSSGYSDVYNEAVEMAVLLQDG